MQIQGQDNAWFIPGQGQGAAYPQSPPQAVAVGGAAATSTSSGPPLYTSYSKKQSRVLGALQLTIAILCVALNIAGLVNASSYNNTTFHIAYGFWCSVLYGVAGALGIKAGKRPIRGWIIASLVLSTFASLLVWAHIGIAAASTGIDNSAMSDAEESVVPYIKFSLALGIMLLSLGVLELMIAIWAACLGCCVTCCGSEPVRVITNTQIVYLPTPAQPTAYPPQPPTVQQGYPGPQPGFAPPQGNMSYQPGFAPPQGTMSYQPGFPPQQENMRYQPGFPTRQGNMSSQPGFAPQQGNVGPQPGHAAQGDTDTSAHLAHSEYDTIPHDQGDLADEYIRTEDTYNRIRDSRATGSDGTAKGGEYKLPVNTGSLEASDDADRDTYLITNIAAQAVPNVYMTQPGVTKG